MGTTAASEGLCPGGVLKRHNLGDADPGPDDRKFSNMSKAKRADKALGAAFKSGKEPELLDLAATALRDQEDEPTSPEWVRELLASLRSDGFACNATTTVVKAASPWASADAETRWAITPLGYTGLPVASLVVICASSAISSDQLGSVRTSGPSLGGDGRRF